MLVRRWVHWTLVLLAGVEGGSATLENTHLLSIQPPTPAREGKLCPPGTGMFMEAAIAIFSEWRQPKCVSASEWINTLHFTR